MQKWYQNRYFLAAIVGLILGIFGGLQQLNLLLDRTHPEYASILGAVLMGIALFVQVLPTPKEIVTPTVRIISTLPIREAAPVAHQEVITTGPETVVTVTPPDPARPEQSSDSVAAAVQQRTPTGRFAPRVIPPAPPAQP